jgi:tetratricopeptide (TPR) repeat protein
MMPRLRRSLFVLLLGLLAPVVHAQPAGPDAQPSPPGRAGEPLPAIELSPEVLYGFLLAEIALQRGGAGLAAQTLVDLAKETRDPRIARRAVEVANHAKLSGLALEAARVWHEVSPDSPQAVQSLMVLLVNARKIAEAEPYIEKVLARDAPAAANGFMQLNRLLAGNPDRRESLRVIERLAKRHPELPQARFAVAQAALNADDEGLALKEIRRAGELRPDWDVAALFEAQILQRSSPSAALEKLAGFLSVNPGSREVRLNYARVLVGQKRFGEARGEFDKLLAASPDNADVVYAVGLLAVQTGDFDVAEANLRKLLDTGFRDSNAVRYTLGQIAEERKDYGGAREWYQSIPRGEYFISSRLRYAQTLSREGRLDDARQFLRTQAEADQGQQVQFVIAEAQLLRDSGKHAVAYEILGEALTKTPDQPELLYDQALTAEKLDRFDVLEANLRRLIALQPDHAHAYNALGYSMADRNMRLDEARKLIEKALELSPDDYAIIDSMGWVLYRLGDRDGALGYLRRAFRGRPDGEIAAHLGEVLWEMGQREEAERIWNDTLKLHPNDEVLRRTIQRYRK